MCRATQDRKDKYKKGGDQVVTEKEGGGRDGQVEEAEEILKGLMHAESSKSESERADSD